MFNKNIINRDQYIRIRDSLFKNQRHDLLYHLSRDPNLPSILRPRLNSHEVRISQMLEHMREGAAHNDSQCIRLIEKYNKKKEFREELPPRVSFAPTYEQCVFAMADDKYDIDLKTGLCKPYTDFYVYQGLPNKYTRFISHEDRLNQIYDYPYTHEICVTTPIRVKRINKIRVYHGEPVYIWSPKTLDSNGYFSEFEYTVKSTAVDRIEILK